MIRAKFNTHLHGAEILLNEFDYLIESIIHLTQADLRQNDQENNLYLRMAYLKNEITEEEMKTKVQRNNKIFEKRKETTEIVDLFVQTVTDIMHRLLIYVREETNTPAFPLQFKKLKENCRLYMAEVEAIRVYANECLVEISHTYKNQCKEIRLFNGNNIRQVLVRSPSIDAT